MRKLFRLLNSPCAYGLVLLVIFGMILPVSSWAEQPEETPGVLPGTELPETSQAPGWAGPPSWTGKAFRQGVVAVSHPLATEVGAKILESGGNAIDAASAIQFAMNVVEPQFSGIGGGGFMMIHLAKTKETFIIESREKAPAAATPDMFVPVSSSIRSSTGLAVGASGTLLSVATALERWGTISLADALQPAIKLAEEGFHVNSFLAAATASAKTTYQPETKAIFRRPDGSPLQEGDLLVQRDLAKTFRLIAEHGPDVFYRGEISPAIVEATQRSTTTPAPLNQRGRLTLSDLDAYHVVIRQPIIGNYKDFTVVSNSPPSSGALTMIQMLKMLERFPLGDTSQGFGFGTAKTLHVMIEAMRLAYADRAWWMGDEDFVPVPKVGLLADPYVQLRSNMINVGSRISPDPLPGDPWHYEAASGTRSIMNAMAQPQQVEDGCTTHFSVVDKWGNIVSYTTTLQAGFGTGIMVPGYGFLLSNTLTDFNQTPTYNPGTGNPGANDIAPYKRPRSSTSPTIVLKNGKPFAAYGSPGGAGIIDTVFQITLNLLAHGMTIQEAIDAPRIEVTSPAGRVSREAGFSEDVINELKALGHTVNNPSGGIGSVQAVIIDLQTGKQYGGADYRRGGTVIGLPRPQNP